MWIVIAGPYSTGTKTEAERVENLRVLNEAALAIFEKGHIPIVGVNLALPMIELAGSERFDEIMMPMSLAAADRCDACLRVGGHSVGADQEMERFRQKDLRVFTNLNEIQNTTADDHPEISA